MLYAGVSWTADGYELAIVHEDGREIVPTTRYAPRRGGELIADLARTGEQLAVVVESTNGTIDGRMMAAGIEVYRADPQLLPERPVFGSVPAAELARTGRRDPRALARLERDRGTQTGLEDWLAADIDRSADAERALTSAGRCLRHGPRAGGSVALTFDDGPLPPYTNEILRVLARYEVPATFFCIGLNALAHPDEVRRIHEQGHSLGNHTWSHPFLPQLSRPQLAEQLDRTAEQLAVTAEAPRFFRPPYGSRTPEVLGWLREFDTTTVLWDVAPDDWAMPGAEAISSRVVDETTDGSIILLHDGGGDRSQTVAALPLIIESLLARGFRFVRVDELANPGGDAGLARAS
jgi:peptidoglycan/xylan/chitin deacetylase (PgdA/CDA1 family)